MSLQLLMGLFFTSLFLNEACVIVFQTLLFATQVGKNHYESHQPQCFEPSLQQISQVTLCDMILTCITCIMHCIIIITKFCSFYLENYIKLCGNIIIYILLYCLIINVTSEVLIGFLSPPLSFPPSPHLLPFLPSLPLFLSSPLHLSLLFLLPTLHSSSVTASVGSLSMTGVPQPGGCQTMMLSSNVPTVGKEAKPLVDVQLEMHPLNKPWMDVAVKAALQPMQITYDFVCVQFNSLALCVVNGGAPNNVST